MATAREVVAGHDLTGRTCVITGANTGLGRESARALASTGARVVLVGRRPDGLVAADTWIRESVPDARTEQVVLDLTSLASVRAGAAAVSEVCPGGIDVLMNNAGVMFTPYGRTADGFETQLGTNHVGHFALTALLTPLLGEGSRIVVLSSAGHRLGDIDLTDPAWERRDYDKFAAYGASKTANLLHVLGLDRRLRERGVTTYAVHPGAVATELSRHMSRDDLTHLLSLTPGRQAEAADGGLQILTPEVGASTQTWAAVTDDLAGLSGSYLVDCAVSDDVRPYAVDADRAEELWAWSVAATGLGA